MKNNQRKKDNNLPLGNYLKTQSNTGEEKLQRNMPVIVDNSVDKEPEEKHARMVYSSTDTDDTSGSKTKKKNKR